MSYWAAYHGQGLCLTETEFNKFLNKYLKVQKNKEAVEQIKEYKEGDVSIEDIAFLSPAGTEFFLFCADDSCTEGFRLTPYYKDGKPNEDYESCPQTLSDNMYVLVSDKEIEGVSCFKEKVYDSYAEFVNEFKEKIAAYLPQDFDWDSHIGIYSYACYA